MLLNANKSQDSAEISTTSYGNNSICSSETENSLIKVLLADDYAISRKGLALLINKFNQLKVEAEAASAAEIWDALKQEVIDVILLNAMSAMASDLSLISSVISEYPSVKIVLFSRHYSFSEIQKFLLLGIHGIISSKADLEEVKTAIEGVQKYGVYYSENLTFFIQNEVAQQGNSIDKHLIDYNITLRDLEVLQLMLQGLTSAEIGDKLCLSRRTIEGRRRKIMQKTKTKSMAELFQFAMKFQLIDAII